ncbi:dephospho-CoA kinase [Tianweitania sp. BSSL-BM11]|uniref:Dephospho-CoA kinase n=1 Tax=Tianweitania aestuarii TaxID=2814886 RepID=A0ABS5RX47_9HYPH|nr:dephospho-CoA kinase [Tianweitania aestuarii]MBS9721641.1 dephospho-CoA kinase [Tianweitania aestuarii]
MIILGLTGSIGMGKSTTAQMFRDEGVPVHDSDETVHRLYARKAVPLIDKAFPGTVVDGVVDRTRLAAAVLNNPAELKRLEAIIHPLVRAESESFLDTARQADAPVAVLDIPLLFETHGEDRVDKIVVVSASPDIQRERVLARPTMTEAKFASILAKQLPDMEKRRRADYVIDTSMGLEPARAAVQAILKELGSASEIIASS